MHDTAFKVGGLAIDRYCPSEGSILEIGSLDVNGSLRHHRPSVDRYIGLDYSAGEGVDHVISDAEPWPVDDSAFDLVIASSVLEHDPLFWATFVKMVAKTRPGGHIYINAPSNGSVHRYPLDCWRFYPDSAVALAQWAASQGFSVRLIESFTVRRENDIWNDWCAVFRREPSQDPMPEELIFERVDCTNIICWKSDEILRLEEDTEDMKIIMEERRARVLAQDKIASLLSEAGHVVKREEDLCGRLQALEAENRNQAAALEELKQARSGDARAARLREDELEARASAMETEIESLRKKADSAAEEKLTLADTIRQLQVEIAAATEELKMAKVDLSEQRSRFIEDQQNLAMREAMARDDLRKALREKMQCDQDLFRTTFELSKVAQLLRDITVVRDRFAGQRDWLVAIFEAFQSAPARWIALPASQRRKLLMKRLKQHGLFDGHAYLHRHADVAASGMDPLTHYLRHGMTEGRELGHVETNL